MRTEVEHAQEDHAIRQEKTRRLLALLKDRLAEANRAGEAALRIEPEHLRSLCSEAGVEGDAVDALQALVRSNRVRLRGRWREGVSGISSPVYVARLIGQGRGTGHPVPTETEGLADGTLAAHKEVGHERRR